MFMRPSGLDEAEANQQCVLFRILLLNQPDRACLKKLSKRHVIVVNTFSFCFYQWHSFLLSACAFQKVLSMPYFATLVQRYDCMVPFKIRHFIKMRYSKN